MRNLRATTRNYLYQAAEEANEATKIGNAEKLGDVLQAMQKLDPETAYCQARSCLSDVIGTLMFSRDKKSRAAMIETHDVALDFYLKHAGKYFSTKDEIDPNRQTNEIWGLLDRRRFEAVLVRRGVFKDDRTEMFRKIDALYQQMTGTTEFPTREALMAPLTKKSICGLPQGSARHVRRWGFPL